MNTPSLPPIAVSVEAVDRSLMIVRVAGELDRATITPFKRALAHAAAEAERTIVDLSECVFIDFAAVAPLLGAHRIVRTSLGADPTIALVISDDDAIAALERAGARDFGPLYTTLQMAVAVDGDGFELDAAEPA